jgi:hypothetical protein
MAARSFSNLVLPVACSLVLAACTAGEVATRGQGAGTDGPDSGVIDPGGDGDGDGPLYDAGTVTPTGDCDDPVTSGLPSGKHNAGRDCLDCHDGNGGAPHWTAAGTIYTAPTGGAALPGATIHLTDADGTEVVLVSAANGNFWTTEALTFPLHARASSCPDDRMMGGAIAQGSCNQSGCHDSAMRISLP